MPAATAVEDLGELHRRYVDLSQRFRAAWVFHQFLQSLGKLSGGEGPPPLAGPFQELYADLKDCSQELNATGSGRLGPRLDAVDHELGELTAALRAEDTRWPPGALRRFFRRYKNYDGKILVQLVRFYLDSEPADSWGADRKDKVDFLVTRLEEEGGGGGLERRDERLAGLWRAAGAPAVPEEQVAGVLRALADIRGELAAVTSLDSLDEREALRTYRDFKHSLGALFFEPRVLAEVLVTNLAFRDVVAQLYAREEKRITEEYQRVLDLGREGAVPEDLDDELSRFHQEVERFERNLERDELRLEELARLRRRVRTLVPRLVRPEAAAGDAGQAGAGQAPRDDLGLFQEAFVAATAEDAPAEDLLAAPYRRLLDALGGVTLGIPAESIVHSADLFPFQLVGREVTAYRRLLGGRGEGGAGDGEAGGEAAGVERFLLEAAALRVALGDEADRARSLEGHVEGFDRARLRRLAALGDAFLRRFEHLERDALLAGRPDEARALAYLRVRLTQPWSEAWLLAWDDLRRGG
ncbi:MAG TPA: hypothetical protein VF100_05085 [Thermoanaerobaculia bacterium]